MDPERWKQIEEVLQSALRRPPDQREEFVHRACSGDAALENEVRSLLISDQQAAGFLQRPAIEVAARTAAQAANSKAKHPSLPVEGQIISHYRVLSKIGGGGMGVVYEAEDMRLGRRVALKLLPENLARDEKALERFEREARAASSLNHPSICTIYEVEEHAQQPVIVMERLEGESLKDRIRTGPLPLDELLEFGIQTSDALRAAHEKKIIHRDIKPANIFIVGGARVKILDFGLAKIISSSRIQEEDPNVESLTAEGVIPGTTAYMSPEQVRGEELDARSDLFSLGVVLYEMATGKRPFTGKNRILLMNAILNAKPIVPSQANTALPAELDGIILRALEKKPSVRYQHACELRTDLQRLKRDSDTPRAVVRTTPTIPGRKRWKIVVLTVAALMLFLVAGYRYFRRAPKLTDKDTIVLADFANATGDPIFDVALRQGLSIQLDQSPFLSIISDQQIQQTLQMMSQKPDAKLTPDIARELCQRTASAAVLEGSISQIGAPYLLTVKAVNCSNGETLASTEERASDKDHVLDALGKSASEMRNKLGESLSTVQRFDTPLEQATTPSLEALKAFSVGFQSHITAGDAAAIPFYERAIELDPNFALAYAWMGLAYNGFGELSMDVECNRKAYELHDRTSEPEKYFITARFQKVVTGNLEKAEEALQLWIQAYPRSAVPHTYLAGAVYPDTAQYEKAVEEGREAVRLSPNFPPSYYVPIYDYISLNRIDEAKALYRQAVERKMKSSYFNLALYKIAFLQNDSAGMAKQVSSSAGKPGLEATLVANEADTAAYSGRLSTAREFSRQAVNSAERAGDKEAAATYSALSALREALFGNADEARRLATLATKHPAGHDLEYAFALAWVYAGDHERAQKLTDDLGQRFPEATIVQVNYLPTLRAKLAISRGNTPEAVEALRTALPYELGRTTYSSYDWNSTYPVYVRGEAHLAAHQGSEAAAEFQKILEHRGIVLNEPIGALAHLQLGRAYAMQGDTLRAKAAYEDFLRLWKDADPDIPVLKQAQAEYAKLK